MYVRVYVSVCSFALLTEVAFTIHQTIVVPSESTQPLAPPDVGFEPQLFLSVESRV